MNLIFKKDPLTQQGYFDLDLSTDPYNEFNLADSVWLSLFCWGRASSEEVTKSVKPFGWWFQEFGSKLWKLENAIVTNDLAQQTKQDIESALQWVIDDGIGKSINVVVSVEFNTLTGSITIVKTDNDILRLSLNELWDAVLK